MSARSFTFKESKKPDPKLKSFPIQAVQLCTIDKFIARYGAPCPNYLKIDVPGFTQEIFAGAWKTLANPAPRQIQVEIKERGRPAHCRAVGPARFQAGRAEDQARKGGPARARLRSRYFEPQCPNSLGA
jgi:hypothetical protein